MGAAVTADAHGVWININSNGISATARDALVTIGLDAAGGTSFTDFITDLGAAAASTYVAMGVGGLWYYFPVFIAAGTSIGAKATVNNTTVGTLRVLVRLNCQPTRPWAIRLGTFVRTFGAVPASSSGTPITAGTAADSATVQLGAALVDDLWFWNVAIGTNQAVESTVALHVDVAIDAAGVKRNAVENQVVTVANVETVQAVYTGRHHEAVIGETVHARMQASAAPAAGKSMIAYGVGGRYAPPTALVGGAVLVNGIPAGGKPVAVFAVDSAGLAERVTTAITNGSGVFSAAVPNDARTYFASYVDGSNIGRSADGSPGGTLDITIGPPLSGVGAVTSGPDGVTGSGAIQLEGGGALVSESGTVTGTAKVLLVGAGALVAGDSVTGAAASTFLPSAPAVLAVRVHEAVLLVRK